jgi:hypothetical protein
MSEYRIEKVRRGVTVVLAGGAKLTGDVFLQPAARYHTGAQEPDELFNEDEPFVPLAVADNQLVILAKDQIALVQYSGVTADTPIGAVAGASVDLVLADGATCSGELRIETRASRSRLLDFLNEEHQRFLTLRSPDCTCLVNRRHVAQVRPRR